MNGSHNTLANALASSCLCACMLLLSDARAQFVRGNEAVTLTPAGKQVQTPPVPPSVGRVCAADTRCHAGSWHMVETRTGLLECTEPYARPTACRASTYGKQKLSRLWIVKSGGTWKWCQYPDLHRKCVDMFARPPANLPVAAFQ